MTTEVVKETIRQRMIMGDCMTGIMIMSVCMLGMLVEHYVAGSP